MKSTTLVLVHLAILLHLVPMGMAQAPNPTITFSEVTETQVQVGESFQVFVSARNDGGDATFGSISVSFPDFTNPGDAEHVWLDFDNSGPGEGYLEYERGAMIGQAGGGQAPAEYLLGEFGDTDWQSGESYTLTLTVWPQETGTFEVYIRANMGITSTDTFFNDPTASPQLDQQGWPVQVYTVQVGGEPSGGLLAYYPLDGDGTDASGNGNDGTVFGATPAADRFGNPNSALSFDGIDDRAELGDLFDTSQQLTLAAWVKLDSGCFGSTRICGIIEKHTDAANSLKSFSLTKPFGSGDSFFTRYYDGGLEGVDVHSDTRAQPGQWYFVATTFDNGVARMYVNGVLEDEAVDTRLIQDTPTPTIIGDNASNNHPMDGVIDDVSFYDRALTAAEVLALCEEGGWTCGGEPPAPPEPIEPGLTVIIHGYRGGTDQADNSLYHDQTWTLTMARAIANRVGNARVYIADLANEHGPAAVPLPQLDLDYSVGAGGDEAHKILVLDWLEESKSNSGFLEAAADAAVALILERAASLPEADEWSLENVHVIGHSRGAIVGSEIVQRLGLYSGQGYSNSSQLSALPDGVEVGAIHFTALDAHPSDSFDDGFGPFSECDWVDDPADLGDHQVNSQIVEVTECGGGEIPWGVVCWENAAYCENYWHQRAFQVDPVEIAIPNWVPGALLPFPFSLFQDLYVVAGAPLPDLNGLQHVPGSWSLELDRTEDQGPDFYDEPDVDHGRVHTWYHGTIDVGASDDDVDGLLASASDTRAIGINPDWYHQGRAEMGFNLSRFGNGGFDDSIAKQTGSVGVDEDNSFAVGDIFNGDFNKKPTVLSRLPGWDYQGGGLRGEVFNPYTRTGSAGSSGRFLKLFAGEGYTHNWLYVPNSCGDECRVYLNVAFGKEDLVVPTMGSPIVIEVNTWGTESWTRLLTISPASLADPVFLPSSGTSTIIDALPSQWFEASMAAYAGSAVRLRIQREAGGSPSVYAAVGEITFEPPSETVIALEVTAPAGASRTSSLDSVKPGSATKNGARGQSLTGGLQGLPTIRVVSSSGAVTGVIGGIHGNLAEEIPGSRYIVIESEGAPSKQYISVPEGDTYTVEVLSNGYEGAVSLYVEDPFRGRRTATALFSGVMLSGSSMLTLTAPTAAADLQVLIDSDGDGSSESTASPSAFVSRVHITAVANGGGSAAPTSAFVNEGESHTVSFTPDLGFVVEDIVVGGVSIGAVDSYTIENPTADVEVVATFAEAESGLCPPGLIVSDFASTGSEFVEFKNVGGQTIDFASVNCSLGATYRDVYFSTPPTGTLAPGATVQVPTSGALRDTFGGLAVIDRDPLAVGTTIPEVQPDIVNSLVYLSGGMVYGFYHAEPFMLYVFCNEYPASRLHPFAQNQCSELQRATGDAGAEGLSHAEMLEAAEKADAEASIPTAFALGAAYPNPFSERAVLEVAVPEDSEIRVIVYDVLGRTVAVLMDERVEAGRYEAVLDARGLASGTYLVRMTEGPSGSAFVATQRITVVR